jgi:hypothetical protein
MVRLGAPIRCRSGEAANRPFLVRAAGPCGSTRTLGADRSFLSSDSFFGQERSCGVDDSLRRTANLVGQTSIGNGTLRISAG